MRYILALFLLLACLTAARAEQPACTGDRHLDDCGQLCPDPTPCPDPGDGKCGDGTHCTCLTTTCQPVTCSCTDSVSGAYTGATIIVNKCPDPVRYPIYAPCRARTGAARAGDLIVGGHAYKCPRSGTPHRYFVPQPRTSLPNDEG